MFRFKSIISRIVILHVVAVVITSIFMSLALSWLMNYATNNIHNKAMQEQAVSVGEHLTVAARRPSRTRPSARSARALFAGLWPLFLCGDRRSRPRAVFLAEGSCGAVSRRRQIRRCRVSATAARRRHRIRRQHQKDRRRPGGLDPDRRGSRQPRRADRRHRRRFLPECRMDHAADPFGVADRRHRDFPPRAAAAARRPRRSPATSGRPVPTFGCRPRRFRARCARWCSPSIWRSTGSKRACGFSAISPRMPRTNCARR